MVPANPVGQKRQSLVLLGLAEVLAMAVWFSASAIVPQVADAWSLSSGQTAWMTMSVQIGFVAGALLSAVLNLPDRFKTHQIIAAGALGASVMNLLLLGVDSFEGIVLARVGTGVMLAGVYPPAMKLVATWTTGDRGAAIGALIGALTLGSAVPHLVNLMPSAGTLGMPPWENVLLVTSLMAAAGALLVSWGVSEGPHLVGNAPFNWTYAVTVLRSKPTRLANFGYLGHMWELYAVWVWLPILLMEAYEKSGWSLAGARLAGFAVIALGAVGCIVAGRSADRRGRTTVTIASLAVSGLCCVLAGLFTDVPLVFTALSLVWGFAVVADSAQFSAAVSELVDKRYVGTALTLQTSMGFLLTLVSIRIVPILVDTWDWSVALGSLAAGPVFAIWSMVKLRALPEALKMASGNR